VSHFSRRGFLGLCAAAAPVLAIPESVLAASTASTVSTTSTAAAASAGTRALRFAHLHTGEKLTVEYFTGGSYLPDALGAVNHLLRDFRTGDEHVIDPKLLDLLHRLTAETGTQKPFEVISGYRSPATNAMLRSHSEGVASHSLHMVGQAIDIRLADLRLPALRDAARSLRLGGVGFYPASNFVHVDTGRIRTW
jgi:uncharacterized protein YcbK (DUF882 family)